MFTFKIIRFFVKTETSKLKEQKMQTERWTDGQTERGGRIKSETDRLRDIHTDEGNVQRQMDGKKDRLMGKQTD